MSATFDNTPPDDRLWPRYQRCLYPQELTRSAPGDQHPATATRNGGRWHIPRRPRP